MTRNRMACVVLPMLVLVAACGGSQRLVEKNLPVAENAVSRLGEQLDRGRIRNAALIKSYASRVANSNPEIADLARVLAKEGTRDGNLYQGLTTRVDDAKRQAGTSTSAQEREILLNELGRIAQAADFDEFNRALTDPLNVLADLSGGSLPRVDSLSANAAAAANKTADLGVGSQLVGNPHYGHWQSGSGGSFWVWYGQFALMRDLMGGPRIGYGSWAGGRNYSYYHDWGRDNYTSPSARREQTRVENTARQKFSREGRSFRSAYATKRQGASRTITRQKSVQRTSTASSRGSSRGFGGYRGGK